MFEDIVLEDNDFLFIYNNIDTNNPLESKDIRSQDRRNYRRLAKEKLLNQEHLSYPKVLRDTNNIQGSNTLVNENNEEIRNEEKQEHKPNS